MLTTAHRRPAFIAGGLLLLMAATAWRAFVHQSFHAATWEADKPQRMASERELYGIPAVERIEFDLSRLAIPVEELHYPGLSKDGIPALTNPSFLLAEEAGALPPESRVIGVVIDAEARAYPLSILMRHEIVNDRVGNVPVAVTYCPLCDSAAVFDRRTPLGEREFGVSGLLYNSNVVMYDRGGAPESLWSQLRSEGISGPGVETSLSTLPVELTTWRDWQSRHPQTKVLAPPSGRYEYYVGSPYEEYFESPGLMFRVNRTSDRLSTKERVLGVWTDGAARAYPASAFGRELLRIEDVVDGKTVVIQFNPETGSSRVVEADDGVQWMYSLWFAWYAFHPDTDVFASPVQHGMSSSQKSRIAQ